jgi:HupE / UreJ protein
MASDKNTDRPARRRALGFFSGLTLLLALAPLSAHEIVVEQIVEMTLDRQGDALVVALHVPAAVTGDPALPGLLKGGDAAALDNRLRIVAADLARNLDVQAGDATLPDPIVTVRRGAGVAAIDVELRYPTRPDEHDFSARLNAFSSKDGPVRTRARYRPGSGREQVVSVTGPVARVAFDPPFSEVLASFAVRGLRALFDSGDHLLFLVCLLLPMRRPRSAATLYAAAAAAQAAVIALCIVRAPMMAPWLSGATLAAASAIVIAAIQNIARARMRWVVLLAIAFGALSGWTFGNAAESSAQFAGAHRPVAMMVFGFVVLLGELWLGALAWGFRTWLDERGLPERIVVVLGSAIVAHSAVHRVMERAQIAAADGSLGGERVLVWLTLAWVGAILLAAASNAIWETPEREHAS